MTGKGVLKATDTQSTNFSNLKVDELKRELDELGVNYDSKAKKAELLELLESHTD
ncbi:HeH/LEM domain [Listeria monocytogenes]|nr:HeH/LEM domain [Listeria monocytogenes]